MSTSIPTPGPGLNAQIYQEACEWLIMLRTGVPDSTCRARLDSWLRKSPEHVRAYLEVSAIWEDVALHDPQRAISPEMHVSRALAEDNIVSFDAAASLQTDRNPSAGGQFSSQHRQRESETPSPSNRGHARPPASLSRGRGLARAMSMRAVAVAVPAAILSGVFAWLHFQSGIYRTDVGEQRSITLADGSIIDLNAHSRIKVRLSKTERDVDLLEGQALFQVAHDTSRPFFVRSGSALVRAVGTLFDVYRKKNGITVSVIEGRVAVASSLPGSDGPVYPGVQTDAAVPDSSSGFLRSHASLSEAAGREGARVGKPHGGEVFLSAGEQVTVVRDAVEQPTHANVIAATSWRQRRLIFDSAPLSEVVDEFNRYNTRQLVIDDSELRNFGVVGVFSSTDPGSLLRFLRAQPGIAVVEDDAQIRITRR
jgi:transmembrane sensor